jgi:hypothetical protein
MMKYFLGAKETPTVKGSLSFTNEEFGYSIHVDLEKLGRKLNVDPRAAAICANAVMSSVFEDYIEEDGVFEEPDQVPGPDKWYEKKLGCEAEAEAEDEITG